MLILHDPQTLKHRTVEFVLGKFQDALESPERIQSILEAVEKEGHDIETINYTESLEEVFKIVTETHHPSYLTHLKTCHADWVRAGTIDQDGSVLPECFPFPTGTKRPDEPPTDQFARTGFFAFDMSTGIMSETFGAAMASANLAVQGVNALLRRPSTVPLSVLALCRPPGHHCDTRRAGGYCYLNNAVAAVTALRRDGWRRPAVLDLDFHHGNGTQKYFYAEPGVFYASIHGEDEFPYYTGASAEVGEGRGEGSNLNLPLPTGSSFVDYMSKLDVALNAIEKFQPDFLVVSLGFDTFRLDPLGSFQIYTEDYFIMAREVRRHRGLRAQDGMAALILLEGGYVVDQLGANMVQFLKGWEVAEKKGGR